MKLPHFLQFALLVSAFLTAHAAKDLREMPLPAGIEVSHDLAYGKHGRQKLDLYWTKDGPPRPLIVFVHGGAWFGGSKTHGVSLAPLEWGLAMASVEYRLAPHSRFPAQIEDCKAAIRWVRAHAREYNLDVSRIGAWGTSAGGHLVALLGTSGDAREFDVGGDLDQSSRVQCVVDFFGPTDFLTIEAQAPSWTSVNRKKPTAPEWMLLGGMLSEKTELARKASPTTWVSRDDPPFLIYHGDRDPGAPLAQSAQLDELLRKAGVESTFVILPGVGHDETTIWKKHHKDIRAFFEKHLHPTAPAKTCTP